MSSLVKQFETMLTRSEADTAGEETIAYDPYIMDHEIVCPKCGAVDHYAMTPKAHLAL